MVGRFPQRRASGLLVGTVGTAFVIGWLLFADLGGTVRGRLSLAPSAPAG